jgi:regulatory protein YycI of two-component signal transduction system YycFG
MAKMELTRDQIKKFVEIYDHFKEIQNFIVEHKEDGQIIVSFNLDDVVFSKDQTSKGWKEWALEYVADPNLNNKNQ